MLRKTLAQVLGAFIDPDPTCDVLSPGAEAGIRGSLWRQEARHRPNTRRSAVVSTLLRAQPSLANRYASQL
jgi:hypothetical protein